MNDEELYEEAKNYVIESNKVSISGIQRKFKIGFNAAAKIVETMEKDGVVSSPEYNGVRKVLFR